jgi:hypothetical protein
MLRAVLHGRQLILPWFDLETPQHPMTLLAHGISSLALCYFLGWFLRVTTIGNSETQREKRWKEKNANVELPMPFREMFQRIRLQNESAGFRILKLRAEARMLETSRTAMVYSFLLCFVLLCGELGGLSLFRLGWGWWVAKLSIPVAVGVTFWRHEQHAWNHYFGNILAVHQIMFPASGSKAEAVTPGSKGCTEGAEPLAQGDATTDDAP